MNKDFIIKTRDDFAAICEELKAGEIKEYRIINDGGIDADKYIHADFTCIAGVIPLYVKNGDDTPQNNPFYIEPFEVTDAPAAASEKVVPDVTAEVVRDENTDTDTSAEIPKEITADEVVVSEDAETPVQPLEQAEYDAKRIEELTAEFERQEVVINDCHKEIRDLQKQINDYQNYIRELETKGSQFTLSDFFKYAVITIKKGDGE